MLGPWDEVGLGIVHRCNFRGLTESDRMLEGGYWRGWMMDAATFAKESALNRQGYESLRDQIRRDHAGQYVALAGGRVVATAPTFDAARAIVAQLEPAPGYYLVFPAEVEPDFGLVYDLVVSCQQTKPRWVACPRLCVGM